MRITGSIETITPVHDEIIQDTPIKYESIFETSQIKRGLLHKTSDGYEVQVLQGENIYHFGTKWTFSQARQILNALKEQEYPLKFAYEYTVIFEGAYKEKLLKYLELES